jgi:hypothetical protein
MKISRSALIVSAWVLGIPCGKPGYVFRVRAQPVVATSWASFSDGVMAPPVRDDGL